MSNPLSIEIGGKSGRVDFGPGLWGIRFALFHDEAHIASQGAVPRFGVEEKRGDGGG